MILILVVFTFACKNSKDENQKVITKTESKESNLNTNESNLVALGQKYFDLWVLTQEPFATKENINSYLDLLIEDVGHQHLP
jgi:hypothetical protein